MADRELPRVHVAFGTSAAGSLKAALEMLGRNEEILHLIDDLSLGPIDPGDVRQRMQWGVDELGLDDDPDIEKDIAEFWQRVTTLRSEIVAWISSRYVTEYCGFLELLWRVNDVPVSVIDVADVEFSRRDGSPNPVTSMAFGFVHHQQMVEKNLYERATRISALERKRYEVEWRRLREENGAMRVLTDSGVVSAPITHYDGTLLSHVTDDWQSFAKVIGDTIGKMEGPYRQCSSDLMIFDRLLRLVEDGVIDGKKDEELWSFRESWVRRRPTRILAAELIGFSLAQEECDASTRGWRDRFTVGTRLGRRDLPWLQT